MGSTRINVCGPLEVELAGRRVEDGLRGRQGGLVVAFLAVNRSRAVTRGELVDLLWPVDPPADPPEALAALLSKVRRSLGKGALEGRRELRLALPGDAVVDWEVAAGRAAAAESAGASGDWGHAAESARAAVGIAERGFLTGHEGLWVEERRRELEELRHRALESLVRAGLALGGAELGAAERAARSLVESAPFRESGHALLMEALAARGDVAEALQVYEELRVRLRDELGAPPGAAIGALHTRLLTGPASGQPPAAPPRLVPEERKLVTVLCAEPAGVGLADPEEAYVALITALARATEDVARFGGTVPDVTGPTLTAVFGAPAAHEDDAARAVAAAEHMVGRGLMSAAGVATGEALVTARGPASGPVVPRAHGLLRDARQGTVAVDAATAAATGAGSRGRARFVGREHELEVLGRLRDAVARDGQPRLALVVGDAGIGKSRLVGEFLAGAAGAVHRGRCLAYGEGIVFWPMREILWSACGIDLDDTASSAAAKLRALVDRATGDPPDEVERVVEALAVTSGIDAAAGSLAEASPDAVAQAIALAWPRLLTALAESGAVTVVLEDLHWAEAPLLDLLELIVARSSGPVLVVATARPEFVASHPAWGVRPERSQIGLGPLPEPDMRLLVADLLGGDDPGRRDRASAAAEGNPFFAEEIVAHLSEAGDPVSLPDSVRTLLAARIDALPDDEKHALQEAAVVGRVFWSPAGEAIRSLERRGLVVARGGSRLPGQTRFAFRHALIREVAYRSIPRARRSRAHAAVARWLEELAGDRRGEFAELLAYHYEAAAAPEDALLAWPDDRAAREEVRARAVAALLEVGDVAYRRLEIEQARRFADRALALAATDGERAGALEIWAHTHHATLDAEQAFARYMDALALATSAGDHAAVSHRRAEATLLCVRYGGALRTPGWVEQADAMVAEGLAEVDEHDETFEVAALLLARAVGLPHWSEGLTPAPLAARRDALRAVAIAERLGAVELVARAVETLGWIVLEQGLCEAEAMGERLVEVCERAPGRVELHESLVVASFCFARAGRFERARELSRESAAQAGRLGPHRALHAAAAETLCLLPTGRFDALGDATEHVPQLAAADPNGTCTSVEIALCGRAAWLHEAGRDAEALELAALVDTARVAVRPSPDPYVCIEMLLPLLGAEACRERLAAVAGPDDVTMTVHRLRAGLQVHAVAREWDEVDRLVSTARGIAGPACASALGSIADWAAAMRLAGAGRPEEAVAAAHSATDALDAFGERYTAARLLADLFPLLPPDRRRAFAAPVAERLEGMGAHAGAARVSAGRP